MRAPRQWAYCVHMEQTHGHGDGHDHEHKHGLFDSHDHDHSNTSVIRIAIALGLTATIMVAQIIGGVISGSLALLADSAHMASDALGLVIALVAAWVGMKPATKRASYGFRRTEVIGALFNAVLVGAAALWILFEAAQRWQEPAEVMSGPVIVIAIIGLFANLVSAWVLAGGDRTNMNMRAALLHVMIDALGSVGVLVSALVVYLTGFQRADTIAAVLIAFLVVPQVVNLIRMAMRVLLEQVPPGLDPAEITEWMEQADGVIDVHDLHVWSIHGTDAVLTAHVTVEDGTDLESGCSILCRLQSGLEERYGVDHATLQLESASHRDHEISC